jgi:peroxiredoxin
MHCHTESLPMTGKVTNANVAAFFCWLLYLANTGLARTITGKVVYEDSSPAPAAVVYALDVRHRLEVINNNIMMAEHIQRAVSDEKGRFNLNKVSDDNLWLFARDLEDQCDFIAVSADENSPLKITIRKPAMVRGQLLKGDKPMQGQEVTAICLVEKSFLQYIRTTIANENGDFEFNSLMPGEYLFQIIQDVPEVGCCFRSVVTKQLRVTLHPGEEKKIELGGTNLPFLRGKVTDPNGNGLHGVWVRLVPQESNSGESTETQGVVWADVTGRDGSYQIFDVPPGKYTLHCFRRLARNSASRVLKDTKTVTITGIDNSVNKHEGRVENIFNISIDLEPFMPLKYNQIAPPISGTLLNGQQFNLSEHLGKIVVLHFYTTWCAPCMASFDSFEQLYSSFGIDRIIVLGISLDEDISDCRKFVWQKHISHPQLYAGPWKTSKIAQDYRVVNIPTTVIIDSTGRIAQMDLFNATLRNFVQELLDCDRDYPLKNK